MATESEMHELIGRAVASSDFRAALLADPERTLREAGCQLTDEQLARLKATDLEALCEGLDERLSKNCYMYT